MYGSWSCSGLENLHFWFNKETTMSRQFIYKKLFNYTETFGSFSIPNEQIKIMMEIQLIWFWLANVLCRYQIIEKKK